MSFAQLASDFLWILGQAMCEVIGLIVTSDRRLAGRSNLGRRTRLDFKMYDAFHGGDSVLSAFAALSPSKLIVEVIETKAAVI